MNEKNTATTLTQQKESSVKMQKFFNSLHKFVSLWTDRKDGGSSSSLL